jgi:hypothetical protein
MTAEPSANPHNAIAVPTTAAFQQKGLRKEAFRVSDR